MKNKLIFSLVFLSMGLCDEASNSPPPEASEPESLVAWGFTSKKSEPTVGAIQNSSQSKKKQADTPSQTPSQTFFLSADFIYWHINQEGLEFAMTGVGTTPVTKGKVFQPTFKWEPGFKVGAGLNFSSNDWDIFAGYTWINTNVHHAVENAVPYPLDFNQFLGLHDITVETPLPSAQEKWALHFNTVDLELGRTILAPKYFVVRPFCGVKGTWQSNNLHATYTTHSSGDITDHRNSNLWGVGLRGGSYFKWSFYHHWSIYSNLALSALWTQNNAKRAIDFPTNPATTLLNTQETIHSLQPVVEMSLGLRFGTDFSKGKCHIIFCAGWEMQDWINYNQLISLSQVGSKGDLMMQGLTFHMKFDF
jgi:hypothetical protein